MEVSLPICIVEGQTDIRHVILRGIRTSLLEEGKNEKRAGAKAVKAKEAKERYKRNAALKVKVEGV
jgi:hypothetical protein